MTTTNANDGIDAPLVWETRDTDKPWFDLFDALSVDLGDWNKVTLRHVQNRRGGSNRDIGPRLSRWKAMRSAMQPFAIPLEFNAPMMAFIGTANALALRKFTAEREVHKETEKKLQQALSHVEHLEKARAEVELIAKKQLKQLTAELESAHKKIAQFSAEADKAKLVIASLNEKTTELKATNSSLVRELKSTNDTQQVLVKQIESSNSLIEKMTANESRLNRMIDEERQRNKEFTKQYQRATKGASIKPSGKPNKSSSK